MTRPYSNRRTLLAEQKKWQQRLDMLGWPAKLHKFWPNWMPGDLCKMLRIDLAKRCNKEIQRIKEELE